MTAIAINQEIFSIEKNFFLKKALNIISKLKTPGTNTLIGKEYALKIYKIYSNSSVEYDVNKYKNNINNYTTKINNNINKATKYASKI